MTNKTREAEFALRLPIARAVRAIARQFADGQPTPEKAEQVRLNTLAVCAVHDYLQMMEIPTELAASESWNPVVRLCADIADLKLTGVGSLECRPLRGDEQTCQIPPEVWEDRIGYVVVQIDELQKQATILGFSKTAAVEELPISQLRSPEDLCDYLYQLRHPVTAAETPTVESISVNLSRWLTGAFETGWQTVESIFSPTQPDLAYDFRTRTADRDLPHTGTIQAKLFDLGIQLEDRRLALIVELKPEVNSPTEATSGKKTSIVLEVRPADRQMYLPPNLQLIVLDESGTTFLEAQSRTADNYIQLQFRGNAGERFSVKVALGDASITEYFVI